MTATDIPRIRVTPFDALAFFVPLAVYTLCISPWPQAWDYAEIQTVPYILGIPHPTGFPLFVLLGWVFSHAVPVSTVAWRVDFFCAMCIAGAALAVRRLALALGSTGWSSLGASLVFAFCDVAWQKASHADVHALAVFLSMLVFLAAADYATTQRVRSLELGALAYGLGLATHPNVMWAGIALVYGVVRVALYDVRKAVTIVALAVVPLAFYAYLPLRSTVVEAAHLDPAEWSPFDGHGEVDWDTNQPHTLDGFYTEVSGSQFSASNAAASIFNLKRYPAYASEWLASAAKLLTLPALALAAIGALYGIARGGTRRTALMCVLGGGFAAVPFAYSYGAELDIGRYLLPSLALTAALAGSASGIAKYRGPIGALVALAMFGIAAFLYHSNAGTYAERTNRGGQGTIDAVRSDVPDGVVVLSNWIDGTALAYGAYVDHSLGSRIVLSWSEADAKLYPAWTSHYRVFVLANFAIKDQVARAIPASCLRAVPAPGMGDELLYEIHCPGT